MTFLPIVDRELRVAARKRNTFWLRVVAAFFAIFIGSAFLLLTTQIPIGPGRMGGTLFSLLTGMSLITAFSFGVFFTTDCISEEKREGTMGFLFLTDLRGYDVVLGKLLAMALRGVFALFAIFPVLALTFVMGGVAGDHFWKTMLALLNATFFSLAGGLLVSTFSWDARRAMGAMLVLLFVTLAVGPFFDSALAWYRGTPLKLLSLASPLFAFSMAGNWPPLFWQSLGYSHLLAWLMLGLACYGAPRTWQVKSRRSDGRLSRSSYWWRFGSERRRRRLREKLLPRNPVLWLQCRERWQGVLIWGLVVFGSLGYVASFVTQSPGVLYLWNLFGSPITMLCYLGVASQAAAFFVEARRSGMLELLLSTPLDSRTIIQGQWRAVLRVFGWPVLVYICCRLVFTAASAIWGLYGGIGGSGGIEAIAMFAVPVALGVVEMVANLIALSWFGMWMGMTSRNATFATLKALLIVQVLPWLVIQFTGLFLMIGFSSAIGGNIASQWFVIIMPVSKAVLTVLKDVIVIAIARRKLYRGFREQAWGVIAPIPSAMTAAPPPIAARS